jgi:NitT/TauT family transport system ATP-binding protein
VTKVVALRASPGTERAARFVELDRVRKVYNLGEAAEVEAVSEASFSVAEGEFVSLLGASGCGKSTLLMMIAGLERPTAGTIRVAGDIVAEPRAKTGVMFQDPTLLPWKTVLENVLFPAVIQKRPLAELRDRAEQLLRMVGLSDFHAKKPHQLSGGMRQRVAICRALLCDPDVLLMDEPFSALDAITRDELNEALLDIWQKTRKTGLFVTHSIREAVFLSDRILVMDRRPSRIVADVTVPFPRPRDVAIQDTARFAELCGFLRGKIQHA